MSTHRDQPYLLPDRIISRGVRTFLASRGSLLMGPPVTDGRRLSYWRPDGLAKARGRQRQPESPAGQGNHERFGEHLADQAPTSGFQDRADRPLPSLALGPGSISSIE
jgi:hypothetical protein